MCSQPCTTCQGACMHRRNLEGGVCVSTRLHWSFVMDVWSDRAPLYFLYESSPYSVLSKSVGSRPAPSSFRESFLALHSSLLSFALLRFVLCAFLLLFFLFVSFPSFFFPFFPRFSFSALTSFAFIFSLQLVLSLHSPLFSLALPSRPPFRMHAPGPLATDATAYLPFLLRWTSRSTARKGGSLGSVLACGSSTRIWLVWAPVPQSDTLVRISQCRQCGVWDFEMRPNDVTTSLSRCISVCS